jgi:hypothetical protein
VAENKEVPDSNIGVPPVRKYANYRTLHIVNKYCLNSVFEICSIPEYQQDTKMWFWIPKFTQIICILTVYYKISDIRNTNMYGNQYREVGYQPSQGGGGVVKFHILVYQLDTEKNCKFQTPFI